MWRLMSRCPVILSVVRRDPEHGEEAHDVALILHHAFDTMGRKAADYAQRRRV